MIADLLLAVIGLGMVWFALLVLMLVTGAGEAGFRLGLAKLRHRPPSDKEASSTATLTTGMLGLMAFMLALTISFSQDRFEARRRTTVDEANAIGTVWLRTNLAGAEGQPLAVVIEDYARLRRSYLEVASPDGEKALLDRTSAMQNQIWQQALALSVTMPPPLAATLVTAINDMFDASLSQRYSVESRPPVETSMMLLVGAMLTMGALGYQMGLTGRRQLVPALLLLAMLTGGVVLIIDLSRPRLGFTRIDTRPLIWTIEGFTAPR